MTAAVAKKEEAKDVANAADLFAYYEPETPVQANTNDRPLSALEQMYAYYD